LLCMQVGGRIAGARRVAYNSLGLANLIHLADSILSPGQQPRGTQSYIALIENSETETLATNALVSHTTKKRNL